MVSGGGGWFYIRERVDRTRVSRHSQRSPRARAGGRADGDRDVGEWARNPRRKNGGGREEGAPTGEEWLSAHKRDFRERGKKKARASMLYSCGVCGPGPLNFLQRRRRSENKYILNVKKFVRVPPYIIMYTVRTLLPVTGR